MTPDFELTTDDLYFALTCELSVFWCEYLKNGLESKSVLLISPKMRVVWPILDFQECSLEKTLFLDRNIWCGEFSPFHYLSSLCTRWISHLYLRGVVVTPVKYECDSKDLTGFTKPEISLGQNFLEQSNPPLKRARNSKSNLFSNSWIKHPIFHPRALDF